MIREVRELMRKAERQGWRAILTKRKHVKLYAPDGKTMICTGSTPSDHRSLKNCIAMMKRAGYRD